MEMDSSNKISALAELVGDVIELKLSGFLEDDGVGFKSSEGARGGVKKVVVIRGKEFFGFGLGDGGNRCFGFALIIFLGEVLLVSFNNDSKMGRKSVDC